MLTNDKSTKKLTDILKKNATVKNIFNKSWQIQQKALPLHCNPIKDADFPITFFHIYNSFLYSKILKLSAFFMENNYKPYYHYLLHS